MMIHQGKQYVQLVDIDTPSRNKKTVRDIQRAQAPMDAILSARTKKPVEVVRKYYLKQKQMTAEESLAFGLIDEII